MLKAIFGISFILISAQVLGKAVSPAEATATHMVQRAARPLQPACAFPIGYNPVRTAVEFLAIANNLGGNYFLCNDIDFLNIEIQPIGYSTRSPFTGTLQGNAKSVRNLKIRAMASDSPLVIPAKGGLFFELGYFNPETAAITRARILNINFQNIEILPPPAGSDEQSALLAPGAYAMIEDVSVDTFIIDRHLPGWGSLNLAGLVSHLSSGTIRRVQLTHVLIDATGGFPSDVGGVLESNYGSVEATSFNGSLRGMSAGGITSGNSGSIEDSSFDGLIEGRNYAGGIAAFNGGAIFSSRSAGIVRGGSSVGGIAGTLFYVYSGSVIDSYSTANVEFRSSPAASWQRGGITSGIHSGYITRSLFLGSLPGEINPSRTGPIIGYASSSGYWTMENNFFESSASVGSNLLGGTALTSEDLMTLDWAALGFDPEIWYFQSGEWPRFHW